MSRTLNNWDYINPFNNKLGYMGWFGYGNLGDEALFLAAKNLLKPATVLSYKLTPKLKTLEQWTRIPTYKSVVLGGGTLINNDNYHIELKEALDHGYKGCVLGTGVRHPEFWDHCQKPWNVLEKWVPLLARCEYIGVRGPLSKQLLDERGVQNVEMIGDLVLSMAPEHMNTHFKEKTVAINIGISHGMVWGTEDEILNNIVELTRCLLDDGWKVVYLPVWNEDVRYIQTALRLINRSVAMFENYQSIDAVYEFLKECELVIGEKLHAVIMALTVNTPAIMLEYRPKCRDFMASMDLLDFNFRTDQLDVIKIMESVEELHSKNLTYRETIYTRVQKFKSLQKERAEHLLKLLTV